MPDKPRSLAKDVVVKMFPKPQPRPESKAGPRVYVSSVQVVRSPRSAPGDQKSSPGAGDDELAVKKPKSKPAAKKPAARKSAKAKKPAAKTTTAKKLATKKAPAKKTAAKEKTKAGKR